MHPLSVHQPPVPPLPSSQFKYQQQLQQQTQKLLRPFWITLVVLTTLFLFVLNLQQDEEQQQQKQRHNSGARIKTKMTTKSVAIETGRTAHGIDYYQCNNNNNEDGGGSSETRENQQLVLLHGSKFTKEDWKTSGILQDLCSSGFVVSAVDLPVQATYDDLQTLLRDVTRDGRDLPVAGLVTPSASGRAITDWAMTGDVLDLPRYVRWWVPVAAGSVHQLTTEQLQSLSSTSMNILSIYGDQDRYLGHDTSAKLQQWSGAVSVELPGRHPCYLDSPEQFVDVLAKTILTR
jgi:hypothetical protein